MTSYSGLGFGHACGVSIPVPHPVASFSPHQCASPKSVFALWLAALLLPGFHSGHFSTPPPWPIAQHPPPRSVCIYFWGAGIEQVKRSTAEPPPGPPVSSVFRCHFHHHLLNLTDYFQNVCPASGCQFPWENLVAVSSNRRPWPARMGSPLCLGALGESFLPLEMLQI